MSAPGWLRWTLAAVMIAVALYHLARLAGSRLTQRPARVDVELTHFAMGAVMTVMLVGTLAPPDSRRLALLFAVPTLWFVWRGMHGFVMDGPHALGVPLRQVVGCAATVYMLVALAGGGPSMAGMTRSSGLVPSPAVGGVLVLATLGLAVWTLAQVRPRIAGCIAGNTGREVAPTFTAGCQLAMNVTTVYMLMVM